MNRVLTPSEKLAIQQTAYDYWYKKQSVAMDWRTLTDNEKQLKFTNWATEQGIALDRAGLTETIRNHKVMEGIDQQNANTAAAGGPGGTNAAVYDPTDDRALVNSANFQASGPGSAPYLRLGAYSAAMTGTDTALSSFIMGGTTKAVVKLFDKNGKPSVDANGQQLTKQVDQAFTGLKDLGEADAVSVVNLIKDPLRAGEAWSMWYAANTNGVSTPTQVLREYGNAIDPVTKKPQLTVAQIAAGVSYLSGAWIDFMKAGN
jgi:hypothetical protein